MKTNSIPSRLTELTEFKVNICFAFNIMIFKTREEKVSCSVEEQIPIIRMK